MISAPTLPDRYAPLAALLEGHFMTTNELGERWRYSVQTLSNARTDGRGLPFVLMPTGGVRYRVSEVVAAEIAGTRGPLSVDRVALELSLMPEVPAELARAICDRLRLYLRGG